jgi:uncharacterized iron-regulated membrane protein
MNFRRNLLSIHRWAAMTLGLIALVSALTGASMAFRPQLEPLVAPALTRAVPCQALLPIDRYVADARRLHPEDAVDFVRVTGTDPVMVRFFNKDTLYFDRCSGRRVAELNRYEGFFGVIEYIHRGRWTSFGGWIMGTGALTVLLLMVGIGVYQWWPRRPRSFAQGFVVDKRLKKGSAPRRLALHRAIGGWVALPLATSALTGLPNASDWLNEQLNGIGAIEQPEPRSSRPERSLPLAQAWATALRLTARPSELLLHVAPEPGDPIEIYAIEADAPHPNARSYVYVDAATGKVLRFAPYRDLNVGAKAYYWALSWHMGQLGLLNQLIIFFGAAGALALGYTGIGNYLRRRRKSAAKRTTAIPELS